MTREGNTNLLYMADGHIVVPPPPLPIAFPPADLGIGDTGISLPTPIPIRRIADMTILKKDNYYAFATVKAILTPYLDVMEHTKHYLHDYVNVCIMSENFVPRYLGCVPRYCIPRYCIPRRSEYLK